MQKRLQKLVTTISVLSLVAVATAKPHSVIAELPTSMACGPRAVAIAAMLIEDELKPERLVSSFDSVAGDHSLSEIGNAVNKLGLRSSFARYDLTDPALPECPVIVPISREGTRDFHLVVLFGRDQNVVQFIDYPHSRQFMELSELSRLWSGEGIEVRGAGNGWFDLPTIINACMLTTGVAVVCLSIVLYNRRNLM